jgi:hypothetical protein
MFDAPTLIERARSRVVAIKAAKNSLRIQITSFAAQTGAAKGFEPGPTKWNRLSSDCVIAVLVDGRAVTRDSDQPIGAFSLDGSGLLSPVGTPRGWALNTALSNVK